MSESQLDGSPPDSGAGAGPCFDAGKAVKQKITDTGLVAALNRNSARLDELIKAGSRVHRVSTDVGVILTQFKAALKEVRESHEKGTADHIAEMKLHREAMAEMIAETKALRESTDKARTSIDKQNRLLAEKSLAIRFGGRDGQLD